MAPRPADSRYGWSTCHPTHYSYHPTHCSYHPTHYSYHPTHCSYQRPPECRRAPWCRRASSDCPGWTRRSYREGWRRRRRTCWDVHVHMHDVPYACTCACMSMCTTACMCVREVRRPCMYFCMYFCMNVHACACMCIHVHVYACASKGCRGGADIQTYMYIYPAHRACIHAYMHTHTHACRHAYVHGRGSPAHRA